MQRKAPNSEEAAQLEKDEPPVAPVDPAPPAADAAETQRKSRKLLAATTSTPPWLLSMFPLGDEVTLVHIQHRDKQLPHFQCRFGDGSKHSGKTPGEN